MMEQLRRRFLPILAFAIICTCSFAGTTVYGAGLPAGVDVTGDNAQPELPTGWQERDGHKYYYSQDGAMQTGKQTIDGKTYYFGTDGAMQTGKQTIDGKTYYFGTDGAMQTGKQTIDGITYYFSTNGDMKTGWQKIGGKKYYFAPKDGKMYTGKKKIGKSYYYFAKKGEMKTGWQKISGKKYYFAPKDGKMFTKRHKIGKNAYYFNKNGVLQASKWVKEGSKTYYCNKNGALQSGWLNQKGNRYYFSTKNNQMQTGWQKIKGRNYYFWESGKAAGVLQQSCIVSTKKGNYYVDGEGVQVTAPEIMQAVHFVDTYTEESWPADTKLRKCFEALWKNYTYQRFYETPSAQFMSGYAHYMFVNGRGNCYRYAASFACIAKVLGYEARVATGQISSRSGGMTPHGLTEVNVGGAWYICDANMQRNHPDRNSYLCTEGNYPYAHSTSARYTLVISDGKVSWV